jgi:flagellar motor protein MotB
MRKSWIYGASWVVLSSGVGCVPYQKYQDALSEIDNQARVIEDLTSKYHQELLKSKEGGTTQVVMKGVDSTEYDRLRAENERLKGRVADLEFSVEDAKALAAVGVQRDASGALVLTSDLLFPPGVADLRKGHLPALDSIADLLRSKYGGESIVIEGHTDSDPLDKTQKLYQHNWNLGYQRAKSVLEYFSEKHRIPMEQFSVVTYGYTKPVAPNDSEDGKSKNRRVVIRRGGKQSA